MCVCVIYINTMVTTNQKPVIYTQKNKRKESQQTMKEDRKKRKEQRTTKQPIQLTKWQ